MDYPAPFRLAYVYQGGLVLKWFHGADGEAQARQEWGDRSGQGARLDRLNRLTGEWESADG